VSFDVSQMPIKIYIGKEIIIMTKLRKITMYLMVVVCICSFMSMDVKAVEIESKNTQINNKTKEFYLDENQKVEVNHEKKTEIAESGLMKVNGETVYKTQDITTFSISEFQKGENVRTGSGTVYLTLYYSIDSTTGAYKYQKLVCRYDVDSSRYRFINVQAGYQGHGQNINTGEWYATNGYRMRSFSDKVAGTSTETITVNSPFLQYSSILMNFGISGITTCKLKDNVNGTISNPIRLECIL